MNTESLEIHTENYSPNQISGGSWTVFNQQEIITENGIYQVDNRSNAYIEVTYTSIKLIPALDATNTRVSGSTSSFFGNPDQRTIAQTPAAENYSTSLDSGCTPRPYNCCTIL